MTRTYRKWDSMIGRCHRPTHPAYKHYGEKGISVCDRWRDDFKAFIQDMGDCPEGLWLDRIDNSKGYEPGNCRWVTPKESAANRRKRPQIQGSLRQLARAAHMPYIRVYQRVQAGWPIDKALSIPVQQPGPLTLSRQTFLRTHCLNVD